MKEATNSTNQANGLMNFHIFSCGDNWGLRYTRLCRKPPKMLLKSEDKKNQWLLCYCQTFLHAWLCFLNAKIREHCHRFVTGTIITNLLRDRLQHLYLCETDHHKAAHADAADRRRHAFRSVCVIKDHVDSPKTQMLYLSLGLINIK